MKIGAAYPSIEVAGDPQSLRTFLKALEALGYDYMMMPDHVLKRLWRDASRF